MLASRAAAPGALTMCIFDVRAASCSVEEPTQHLLSVVESGFGDLNVFNSLVQALFEEDLFEAALRREDHLHVAVCMHINGYVSLVGSLIRECDKFQHILLPAPVSFGTSSVVSRAGWVPWISRHEWQPRAGSAHA